MGKLGQSQDAVRAREGRGAVVSFGADVRCSDGLGDWIRLSWAGSVFFGGIGYWP
jgi:hypothetical protein